MDYVCCIYPTAPLIEKDDLIKGYEIIKTGKWNSVIAATNFSYPIFRSFENLPDGGLKMIFPEYYNSRSQDLPEVYHDAGLFYWAKPEIWKKKPKGYNKKNSIVKIPNYRIQDIDTLDDWKKAEIIYKIINREIKYKIIKYIIMDIKENYALNHSKKLEQSLNLNKRLFNTYNRITQKILSRNLSGVNIDLGCGDQGFTEYLKTIDIISYPYDYPSFDIEKDSLKHNDESIDFVTMNAVIEHIKNPDNIFKEIRRSFKNKWISFC
jgi:hypothetical protein